MTQDKNYEKIIDLMNRNVNKSLREKRQFFVSPSELKITYSHSTEEELIFSVQVSHINQTFMEGIGFAMLTMFEALEDMGFKNMYTGKPIENGGYQYAFSINAIEALKLT